MVSARSTRIERFPFIGTGVHHTRGRTVGRRTGENSRPLARRQASESITSSSTFFGGRVCSCGSVASGTSGTASRS